MTEWQMVGVIVTLIGLGATILTPLLKLNTAITRLSAATDALSKELERQDKKAEERNGRLWEHEHAQDDQLDDHEKRLTVLEVQNEKQA